MSVIVYLDWSNLCEAFRVRDEPTSVTDAHRALHRTVENLSRRRRLALSPAHVAELLLWCPKERAIQMARWLDSMNIMWVRALNPNFDDELHSWLDSVDPHSYSRRYRPFAGKLLAAYATVTALSHEDLVSASCTIESMVNESHAEASSVDVQQFSVQRFKALHADRAAAQVASDEEVKATLQVKFRSLLIQKGLALGSSRVRTEAEVSVLVDRILEIPGSVPFNRLANALICSLADSLLPQDPSSNNFERRYRGMSYDLQHLIGGAYCDVFTCDSRVDAALGEARERLGLRRQLSIGGCGGLANFVEHLGLQCKSAG